MQEFAVKSDGKNSVGKLRRGGRVILNPILQKQD
jgi:hypothetical protein